MTTHISYVVDTTNANAHLLNITLTISQPSPDAQVVWLPVWTIGSYLIRDFSKHIVSLNAFSQSDNQALSIKQLDKNHWSISPSTSAIVIRYQVYAFDPSVRSAYLSNARAFFNANAILLAVDGQLDKPCTLSIKSHPNHSVYTTLPELSKNHHQADNYDHLIDCPVEITQANVIDFNVNDIKHRVAISGRHSVDKARLVTDLERICAHHHRFFGEVPFDQYLFLVSATHNNYGGLEHRNSTALICPRDDLPAANLGKINASYMRFLALCSHEYFHAWWVKQIKPEAFINPDLSQEVYTEQLWIFEGFTSYYDELTLLRTQLISLKKYLTLFSKTISRVYQTPGRFKQSLASAGFETWTKFYQPNENSVNANISYYAKGALFSFVLDMEIRKQTNDQYTLDDVLKKIWQTKRTTGVKNDSVQKTIQALTNINMDDFFKRYLYTTADLPVKEAFAYLGINFALKANKGQTLGISTKEADSFVVIDQVMSGSAGEQAGLYVNDVIIAINDVRIGFKTFNEQLQNYRVNESITLSVFRDHILHHIDVVLARAPKHNCQLSVRENSSTIVKERLNHWYIGQC